eukprot:3794024-Prymnesium_polylepis.1
MAALVWRPATAACTSAGSGLRKNKRTWAVGRVAPTGTACTGVVCTCGSSGSAPSSPPIAPPHGGWMGGAVRTTCAAARAAARRRCGRGRSCRSLTCACARANARRQHAATVGRGVGILGWGGRPAGLRTVVRPTCRVQTLPRARLCRARESRAPAEPCLRAC